MGYLTASDAVLTYATIENLNAANLNITDLSADVGNITTILSGSIGTGSLQTVHLTGDNVVIDDAVITSAMIADLSASKLTAGTIYTDKVTIQSESGNLYITDNTIQIQDGTTVRVQIGEDASGDYNLYLWDAAGNLLWDAGGLYAAGIHDGIIRDIAVADDAAISGTKLDIASVASELNADGSLTVNAANITIDNTTLDVAYTTITSNTAAAQSAAAEAQAAAQAAQSTADDAASAAATAASDAATAQSAADSAAAAAEALETRTTTLETELEVVQGQISAIVSEDDITTLKDGSTTLYGLYSALNLTVGNITMEVSELTTTVSGDGETLGLTERVATLETTADSITASVSSVQSQVGDLGTTISDVSASLALTIETDDAGVSYGCISANADYIAFETGQLVINAGNFTLDADGNMSATNGSFSGTITATSGEIAGWTIGNYRLYAELTALETTTETVYVTDEDGNYIQETDDEGNLLYYTDSSQSATTTEETDYPVYQTETEEVTTANGYDSYTILNALKSTGTGIGVAVGASDPTDPTTGLIRLYANGNAHAKWVTLYGGDSEPRYEFNRDWDGVSNAMNAKIYLQANATGRIGFATKGANDSTATYSISIDKYGITPYSNNKYSCGMSGLRWTNVYTNALNASGRVTAYDISTSANVITANNYGFVIRDTNGTGRTLGLLDSSNNYYLCTGGVTNTLYIGTSGYTSYNKVTDMGTAASRVCFHLRAEAVRMGE